MIIGVKKVDFEMQQCYARFSSAKNDRESAKSFLWISAMLPIQVLVLVSVLDIGIGQNHQKYRTPKNRTKSEDALNKIFQFAGEVPQNKLNETIRSHLLL